MQQYIPNEDNKKRLLWNQHSIDLFFIENTTDSGAIAEHDPEGSLEPPVQVLLCTRGLVYVRVQIRVRGAQLFEKRTCTLLDEGVGSLCITSNQLWIPAIIYIFPTDLTQAGSLNASWTRCVYSATAEGHGQSSSSKL